MSYGELRSEMDGGLEFYHQEWNRQLVVVLPSIFMVPMPGMQAR